MNSAVSGEGATFWKPRSPPMWHQNRRLSLIRTSKFAPRVGRPNFEIPTDNETAGCHRSQLAAKRLNRGSSSAQSFSSFGINKLSQRRNQPSLHRRRRLSISRQRWAPQSRRDESSHGLGAAASSHEHCYYSCFCSTLAFAAAAARRPLFLPISRPPPLCRAELPSSTTSNRITPPGCDPLQR